MDDPEWLLKELERWQAPGADAPNVTAFREAAGSHEHQRLARQLLQAIVSAPAVPAGGPLPPPF